MAQHATTYRCAACGTEADNLDGRIVRRCQHNSDPVIANVSAIVHAHGAMMDDEAAPAEG